MAGQELPIEEVLTKNPSEPSVSQQEPSKQTWFTGLLDYLEVFAFAIAIVILIFTFFGRMCRVDGESMKKTLFDGQQLIVSDLFYEPQREDIIVFSMTSKTETRLNEAIVKRVIAVAGDKLYIDFATGTVFVNDQAVTVLDKFPDGQDSYVYLDNGHYSIQGDMKYPITIPDGYIFVMGDNRNNSLDSRFSKIGLVDTRRVLGKVLIRVTPFSEFGPVD